MITNRLKKKMHKQKLDFTIFYLEAEDVVKYSLAHP